MTVRNLLAMLVLQIAAYPAGTTRKGWMPLFDSRFLVTFLKSRGARKGKLKVYSAEGFSLTILRAWALSLDEGIWSMAFQVLSSLVDLSHEAQGSNYRTQRSPSRCQQSGRPTGRS